MPYRTSATLCVVRLIPLRRLSATTLTQCESLRQEAGRCWTDLVAAHQTGRAQGRWLSVRELELLGAAGGPGGPYALHCQTIQALAQKPDANLATATELRKQEAAPGSAITTAYPYHSKPYQTVSWKDQAMQVQVGQIRLSNGAKRAPLLLTLPEEYHQADIRKAELTWRADHYELCLTIDTGEPLPPPQAGGEVSGVDLGEVHIAAITTTRRQALVLSGRHLRACKQGRNRAHSIVQEKLSRCQRGSRRWRRLSQRKAQDSAKLYRQQRDILHQAARKAVRFCQAQGVSRIAVGDVHDIQTGVSLGRQTNQKISQWPHGQFVRYLTSKAQRLGISVEQIDERYSSRTCSHNGHVHPTSPRGRRFRCAGCGARAHRDVNGSANICSKAAYGRYGQVQADRVKYLRPIVVAPRHRPK
jgi:putative transposase